jgi:hypothetical protein
MFEIISGRQIWRAGFFWKPNPEKIITPTSVVTVAIDLACCKSCVRSPRVGKSRDRWSIFRRSEKLRAAGMQRSNGSIRGLFPHPEDFMAKKAPIYELRSNLENARLQAIEDLASEGGGLSVDGLQKLALLQTALKGVDEEIKAHQPKLGGGAERL